MKDPRLEKLAKILVHHSTRVQAGENVLIETFDLSDLTLVKMLIEEIRRIGANPLVDLKNYGIIRKLLLQADEEMMNLVADVEVYRMKKVQAHITIRNYANAFELSDLPSDKIELYNKFWIKPVYLDVAIRSTKWVVLRYPTPSMAQKAEMSTEAFEDFYFNVCTLDYAKMAEAVKPLKKLMEATDKVHIVGPETDLNFSIKGIPTIPCTGEYNIPDGEIFTAPVKDSINGFITFNVPHFDIDSGQKFQNVRLEFQNGKIVKATCDRTEELNKLLDTDEGARFCGEFALSFNPYLRKPILELLFDEKIDGALHLAYGSAYDEADNGNRSAIHNDLILIQRPEYGGGEIYFDGVLIRKDGLFIPESLRGLNPENLK
jgi:aminopeptidase